MALNEDLVDNLGAAASWKTEDEGVGLGGIECFDAAWDC